MNPGQRPVSSMALFVHLKGEAAKQFGKYPSTATLAAAIIAWLREYMASRI